MNMSRLNSICDLQQDILLKAVSIVKIEGIIIYSTCSLSFKQNEEVIKSTISQINNSSNLPYKLILLDIFPNLCKKSLLNSFGLNKSPLNKTLRITPGPQSASAMYIAKLKKIKK